MSAGFHALLLSSYFAVLNWTFCSVKFIQEINNDDDGDGGDDDDDDDDGIIPNRLLNLYILIMS